MKVSIKKYRFLLIHLKRYEIKGKIKDGQRNTIKIIKF